MRVRTLHRVASDWAYMAEQTLGLSPQDARKLFYVAFEPLAHRDVHGARMALIRGAAFAAAKNQNRSENEERPRHAK